MLLPPVRTLLIGLLLALARMLPLLGCGMSAQILPFVRRSFIRFNIARLLVLAVGLVQILRIVVLLCIERLSVYMTIRAMLFRIPM